MYAIKKIYRIDRSEIKFYETSEITPEEALSGADVCTVVYIAVRADDSTTTVTVNYSKLITDTTLGQYNTWDLVASHLTDEYVNGYTETMPGYIAGTENPRHPAQLWDAMNTLNTFDLDYGKYTTDRHGILAYMHNLPDLRISIQSGATTYPNLANCIPIVNGFICRPYYREDDNVLYALDGARLCWQVGDHRTPEVQLVDFSEIGDILIKPIRFTKPNVDYDGFTISFASRTNNFDIDADWIFTSSYDLTEYSPILVLAGTMIFPDKIKRYNTYSFKCAINPYPWDMSLVYKRYLIDEPSTKAHMHYNGSAFEQYLQEQLDNDAISPDAFVILVKTSSIYVNRIPLDVWDNGILVNLYTAEGLLLHNKTNTCIVYHCDTYSDHKELVLQNMETVLAADNHFRSSQLAFVGAECYHQNFRNIHTGNCTMIHLMR